MDFLSVFSELIDGILREAWVVASQIWWVFLPFIFFPMLKDAYLTYVQDKYVRSISWVLLQIKIPKEILTTPKAMEQIFASMYASYSHGIVDPKKFIDINGLLYLYLDGFVDNWYSFEMVGHAGGIEFYVMTPAKMRNMVEAAIYAQYPEVEVSVASEDYCRRLPRKTPNESYDLWGTDLGFGKASAYPIRTYPHFEAPVDEQRLDPIGAIAEVMSNLKENEHLWWQVVVSPSDHTVGNNWVEEGESIIKKITGEDKREKKKSWFSSLGEWLRNILWAPAELPLWGEAKETEAPMRLKFLNPAEQEVVKEISHKIGQLGFETKVRFIYIGKREGFSSATALAIMGAERQFNTQDLNQLKPGKELTLVSGWKPRFIPFYATWVLFSQKKKLFDNYRTRRLGTRRIGKFRPSHSKIFTFSTEELATIFHFPISLVKAPKLERIESKTGAPPPTLPIE